ncbi:MAG TPA: hypothetical protein PK096_04480 [Candidatus Saccharibacteria bacterium]|nr:hypothetical protein [Candidatus Saccharibacteria bacterium]HRK94594.1 hypothetical protein [Candidatus Saccharibacteria bacterium]
MRHIIKSSLRQLVADRTAFLLCLAILLGGIIYIIYVAINLSPSDLQLATRYTSYGETHFYRNKWYYLLSFVGFGLIYITAHIGMVTKLVVANMKQLAHAMGWLSLVVLLMMYVYTYYVLGIAYLS